MDTIKSSFHLVLFSIFVMACRDDVFLLQQCILRLHGRTYAPVEICCYLGLISSYMLGSNILVFITNKAPSAVRIGFQCLTRS